MELKPYIITTKEYIKEAAETGWTIAYGNFLDRFYNCDNDAIRQEIIQLKPEDSEKDPAQLAVIAATVESLAKMYDLSVPEWVYDEDCYSKEPFYGSARLPETQRFLRETTPSEFASRGIYFGEDCMSRV